MQLGLKSLYTFLEQSSSQTFVLATVFETKGASYRKAGAMMLIDEDHDFSGLVSGGCLEDDLIAHAASVFQSGQPKTITYDLSLEESASLWGLGLGCGGMIRVFLERICRQSGLGGLEAVKPYWRNGQSCTLTKIVEHSDPQKIGRVEVDAADEHRALENQHAQLATLQLTKQLTVPISPAPKLLICGAGPDAIPLAKLAAEQFWAVTVADHRPAHLNSTNFPHVERLLEIQPSELSKHVTQPPDAAVIMTHNVERDAEYLTQTVNAGVPYIGLLGPAARRDQLLEKAGLSAGTQIHGPAGLDLGAVLPEEIALSIMAQIQALRNARQGNSLSELA